MLVHTADRSNYVTIRINHYGNHSGSNRVPSRQQASGHLAIFKNMFHVNTDTGIMFDILLHFGTLVAIFIVYWKDIVELIVEGFTIIGLACCNVGRFFANLFSKEKKPYRKIIETEYRKFVMLVILSTLVTMVIALPFESKIENAGNTLLVPGFCLCITSVILFIADRVQKGNKGPAEATYKNSLFIGLAQGIATLPGISRSGSTITAGLACGFNREFAVKYSFIMSIPTILGACILQIPDLAGASLTGSENPELCERYDRCGRCRLPLYQSDAEISKEQ